MTDYYGLLEVPRDATPEQIKKAYRRKSAECHPDRNGGDSGAMAAVNKAYEVLSDPVQRALYDAEGEKGVQEAGDIQQKAERRLKDFINHLIFQMAQQSMQIPSIKAAMTHHFREALMQEEDNLDSLREALGVLKKQKGRLSRRSKGAPNFFEEVVDEHILQCSGGIADAEKTVAIVRLACSIVEDFDDAHSFTRFFMLGGH